MVHHCIGLQPERHISTKLRKRKRTNQLSATVPWKDFRHKAQLRMMSCCGEQLSDSLTSFASGSKGQELLPTYSNVFDIDGLRNFNISHALKQYCSHLTITSSQIVFNINTSMILDDDPSMFVFFVYENFVQPSLTDTDQQEISRRKDSRNDVRKDYCEFTRISLICW